MEVNDIKYLIVFESYNQSMLLYNNLNMRKCKVEFISTPCGLSRGCSQSLVFCKNDYKLIIEEVNKSKINIMGIYKMVNKDNRIEYIHI